MIFWVIYRPLIWIRYWETIWQALLNSNIADFELNNCYFVLKPILPCNITQQYHLAISVSNIVSSLNRASARCLLARYFSFLNSLSLFLSLFIFFLSILKSILVLKHCLSNLSFSISFSLPLSLSLYIYLSFSLSFSPLCLFTPLSLIFMSLFFSIISSWTYLLHKKLSFTRAEMKI